MGIYKRGSIWYARWFEDGRLRRRSLGTGDQREAEGAFAILYSKPGDPDPEYGAGGRAGRIPRTFGELVDGWMERVRLDHADKRATVDAYAVQARRGKRRWGRRAPDAVTRADLMQWRDERLGEVSKRTVKYERSVLLAFLRWAPREGLIPVLAGRGRPVAPVYPWPSPLRRAPEPSSDSSSGGAAARPSCSRPWASSPSTCAACGRSTSWGPA